MARLSILYLPNPSGPPYYNITPASTPPPQYSLILDSRVLNPYGFLEPSLQSFGIDLSHFYENFTLLSKFLYDCFSLLFSQQRERVYFVTKINCYGLCATQFLYATYRWTRPTLQMRTLSSGAQTSLGC